VNEHKLARLTPLGRRGMVQRLQAGEPLAQVARQLQLSTTTVRRWWRRYQVEGVAGLQNRSSRPHRSPRALPRWRRRQILQLRRQRRSSLDIAAHLGLPLATVVQVQRRLGIPKAGGAHAQAAGAPL
jgi:transposase-like protein